jgi:hypothetical protein
VIVRGFACRSRGRHAGCLTDVARRIEPVERVGYFQGYAGTPALIAAHWGGRLRRSYLAGYRRGRDDRRRAPAPAAERPAVHFDREAR